MSRDDHYYRRLDAAADAEYLMGEGRYHDDVGSLVNLLRPGGIPGPEEEEED